MRTKVRVYGNFEILSRSDVHKKPVEIPKNSIVFILDSDIKTEYFSLVKVLHNNRIIFCHFNLSEPMFEKFFEYI